MLWELTHAVMEAKRPCSLLCRSWEAAKACGSTLCIQRPDGQGVTQAQSPAVCTAPMSRGRRTWCPSLSRQEVDPLRPPSGFLFLPFAAWMIAFCLEKDNLSDSICRFLFLLISSGNTLINRTRHVSPAVGLAFNPVTMTIDLKNPFFQIDTNTNILKKLVSKYMVKMLHNMILLSYPLMKYTDPFSRSGNISVMFTLSGMPWLK